MLRFCTHLTQHHPLSEQLHVTCLHEAQQPHKCQCRSGHCNLSPQILMYSGTVSIHQYWQKGFLYTEHFKSIFKLIFIIRHLVTTLV